MNPPLMTPQVLEHNTAHIFTAGFWQDRTEMIITYAVEIALVLLFFIVVRFIAYKLIDRVLKHATERESAIPGTVDAGRLRTLCGLTKSIIFYLLTFITAMMVLDVFRVDTRPVLTAAGVVGLAIGFGGQKLVKDVISGFFAALENQYSVGERVTIGAITGTVIELGMRVTRLRDDTGKLVIISNGDIIQVINHSRGPLQAVLEVSVPNDADLESVRAAIDRAGEKVASTIEGVISVPKAGGVIAIDATKMTIRVSGEVQPGRQDAVQTALRELIRDEFDQEMISFV